MANNRIDYSIGFKVDQTGLNQAKSALQELQRLSAGDLMKINNTSFDQAKKDLKELKANASVLENALNKAFNANLGTVNVSKFNQELKKSNITLDQIYAGMSKAGYAGEAAFRKTATQVLTTNTQLKQSHKILDDIAKTMGNTIKWGIASSAMNTFTGSIQKAYGYVKHLDTSLNDIRIVTEKSAEQMDTFAVKANKAAKDLRASTTDYTEAALIYYQQGLADKEVQARTDSTLKAANVTGQSGAEVSEQLTAVWNGYKVSAQETELYVDKLAAVAASTASDLEELSTGMSKVASAAAASGVDIDQLNGHLSTVISVTRQAPESVGTAFKTIYARLGDLAVDGEDEFGTKLGEVSNKLKIMGIDILDSQGQMREMGTVMEEVAEKWDGWTQAQRQAAAVAMAGKRQYNNLIALFDNWDMYTDAVNTSANAMGTLQNQQDIYMESTAAHLQRMQTSWEGVYDSVLDTDTINFWLDAFAGLGTGLEHLVDGLGGGNNALLLLGSTAMKVFDKQIANSLSITLNNFKKVREQAQNTQAILATQSLFKDQRVPDGLFNDLVKMKQSVLELGTIVSSEEHEIANSLMQGMHAVREQAMAWDDNLQSLTDYARGLQGYDFEAIFRDISAFGPDDKDAEMFSLKGITGDEEAVIDLNNAITAQKEIISHATNEVAKYDKELEKILPTLKEMEINVGSGAEETEKLSAEEQKGIHLVNDLKASMEQYAKEVKLSNSNQKAFDSVLKQSFKQYQEGNISIHKMAMMLSGTFKKALADGGKDAQRFADILEQEINQASGAFDREVTEMEQKWKSFQQQLQQKSNIANVVSLIGTIGQLASAMQTIINLGSVWQNEDLSTGEKLLQTISSLGMTLPMLTMNLGQAKEALMLIGGKLGIVDKAFFEAMGKAQGLTEKLGVLKGSLGTLTKSFGPYIAIAAVAVSAATALYMWWTKDERAAKKAAEGARQAAEALEAVKTEQQAVADTLSAYKDAETAMSKLTKGTQEWRDALNETNNSVLTLLETFPELADTTKGYMENINGQLILTDEGKEYVQEQSSNKVATAQSASYATSAESLKAQNISDITNFARSVQVQTGGHGGTSGSLSSDVVDRAVEAINTSGSAYLSSVETIQKELEVSRTVAEALYANTEELTTLAGTISANTAAQELYYQQAAAGYLQDSETYQNATTEEQGVINQVAGAWLEKEADRLYESTYKQGSGMSDKDAQQAYAELIGAEDSKNKGGNKGEYLIDGEWKTVTDEVARMALAMQEASGGVDAFAEDVLAAGDTISRLNLDDSIESAVLGFSNGETADLTNLTTTQLEEMSNALDGMSDEAIDQLADQLGYVSDGVKSAGDIFKEKVSQAAEDEVTRRAEDVAAKFAPGEDGFAKTSQDLHDSLNNMSIEDFRGEQRDALTAAGGTDALLASIDPEQIQRLVTEGVSLEEAFNEIDWSALDSSKPIEWFKGAFETAIADAKYSKENEGDVEGNFAAHAEEYDIDETVYRDLTERIQENAEASDDFADSLKTQEDAAQEVAKEILRYDKALESVQENGDEWLEVLENGAEQDLAENIGAIAEAYENMLDLDPGTLSDDFLENAENMKLMQQAAEGNTAAYEELQKRAGEDILTQVGIDTDRYAEDLATIEGMAATVEGEGLADVEAGAKLDNEAFLNSLSEMVTEAGMSAEEAQNYLASMGIDAEVTEDTTNATEDNTVNSLMPSLSWENKSWNLPLVGDFTLPLPKLKFNPIPSPFSNKKQFKAHGLKVSNAKKSSGGDIKHKNSSHGGGSKKPSGGGGGGGGGGGSTSTKSYNTTSAKKDPFHNVNNRLKKLTTEFDRLSEKQNKLFGKELLDNLNKQLNVINRQVKATKDKLKIARDELALMQKRKTNERKGYKNDLLDFGVTFNKETGAITNYNKIAKDLDDKVAKLNRQWNKMSAKNQDGKKGEALQKRIERAEANRDMFHELVEQYDELLYETIPELIDEKTQLAYKQIEIKIEAFNIEADLRLNVDEAIKDWYDFVDDVWGDSSTFEELMSSGMQATLKTLQTGSLTTLTENLSHKLTEAQKVFDNQKSSLYSGLNADGTRIVDGNGNFVKATALAKEDVEETIQKLQEGIESIYEYMESIMDNYNESIDDTIDKMDEYQNALDNVVDTLEHQNNLLSMLNGDRNYDEQLEIENQKQAALEDKITAYNDDLAFLGGQTQGDYSGNAELVEAIGIKLSQTEFESMYNKAREEGGEIAASKWAKDYYQAQVDRQEKNIDANIQASQEGKDFATTEGQLKTQGETLSAARTALADLENQLTKAKEEADIKYQASVAAGNHGFYEGIIEDGLNVRDLRDQINAQQKIVESAEEEYNILEDKYLKQKETVEQKKAEAKEDDVLLKNYQMLADNAQDAVQKNVDAYTAAMEGKQEAAAAYAESIQHEAQLLGDKAVDTLEQSLTGGKGLDQMEREFEFWEKEQDRYLDDVNKAYEIESLANKMNQAINEAGSISAQKRLNALKDEELKKLREKDKLTQYEVDRANELFDLELKRIALEEAQNNKAQMRLRRDSSGNYSYQFIADQEKIAQAQQELSDMANDIYNKDKERYAETTRQMIEDTKEAIEYARNYFNSALTEQEERADEFDAFMGVIYESITDAGNDAIIAYTNAGDSGYQSLVDSVGKYKAGIDDVNTAIETAATTAETDFYGKIDKAVQDGADGIAQYASTWWDQFSLDMESGALTMAAIVTGKIDAIPDALNSIPTKITETTKSLETTAENIAKKVEGIGTAAGNAVTTAQTETEAKLPAFKQIWDTFIEDIKASTDTLDDGWIVLGNLLDPNGTDANNPGAQVKNFYSQATEWSESLVDQLGLEKTAAEELAEAYGNILANLEKIATSEALTNAINGLNAANDWLTGVNQDEADKVGGKTDPDPKSTNGDKGDEKPDPKPANDDKGDKPDSTTTITTKENNGKVNVGEKVIIAKDGLISDSAYKKPTSPPLKKYRGKTELYVQKYIEGAAAPFLVGTKKTFGKGSVGWLRKKDLKKGSFDTGGYTGDWAGKDGKMAMLHSKELVLNKKDTQNMLQAIALLREYANQLSTLNSTKQFDLLNTLSATHNIRNANELNSQNKQNQQTNLKRTEELFKIDYYVKSLNALLDTKVKQLVSQFEPMIIDLKEDKAKDKESKIINVQVNADFPNANNVDEIKAAFANLTNITTQKIHSTIK